MVKTLNDISCTKVNWSHSFFTGQYAKYVQAVICNRYDGPQVMLSIHMFLNLHRETSSGMASNSLRVDEIERSRKPFLEALLQEFLSPGPSRLPVLGLDDLFLWL